MRPPSWTRPAWWPSCAGSASHWPGSETCWPWIRRRLRGDPRLLGRRAEHAAQRVLVGHLVDRLHGKKSAMYEVTVRDIPARSLLSLMQRLHEDDLIPMGRELFIHRLARGGVPRIEGIAGAPSTIFYGEVSGDSDGPVEWCWPVPDGQAEEIAATVPRPHAPPDPRVGGIRPPRRPRHGGRRGPPKSPSRPCSPGRRSSIASRPGRAQRAGLQPCQPGSRAGHRIRRVAALSRAAERQRPPVRWLARRGGGTLLRRSG